MIFTMVPVWMQDGINLNYRQLASIVVSNHTVVLCGLDVCVSPVWLYYGLGEFPWEAPHHGEWRYMVWALRARRPDLYLTGNRCIASVPWRDGTGRTESGDRARLTPCVLRRPDESLKRFWTLRERWAASEYSKGLGNHTSGCEFELETPLDHYWIPGRRNDNKRPTSQRDGFIKHMLLLPRKAETPPRTR